MGLVTASSINFDMAPAYRVMGYYVYDDMDKDITSIRELLVDEATHRPRYVIIEVGGFLSIMGKKILIPWSALAKGGMSRLNVNCSMEQVLAAPSPHTPLSPTQVEEEGIHRHFNVEPYWFEESPDEKPISGSAGEVEKPEAPGGDSAISGLSLEKDAK
ncbi:MAG: PRC-barrel domain-containing protein [Nitrospinae bacterium]|nr:PRC-barrel domain-containing protein [Nitrospinota bacterium]